MAFIFQHPPPHSHLLLSYFPLVAEAFDMEYYSIQRAKETHCLTNDVDSHLSENLPPLGLVFIHI